MCLWVCPCVRAYFKHVWAPKHVCICVHDSWFMSKFTLYHLSLLSSQEIKPKTSDTFGLASSLFWELPLHFLRQASEAGRCDRPTFTRLWGANSGPHTSTSTAPLYSWWLPHMAFSGPWIVVPQGWSFTNTTLNIVLYTRSNSSRGIASGSGEEMHRVMTWNSIDTPKNTVLPTAGDPDGSLVGRNWSWWNFPLSEHGDAPTPKTLLCRDVWAEPWCLQLWWGHWASLAYQDCSEAWRIHAPRLLKMLPQIFSLSCEIPASDLSAHGLLLRF